MPKRKRDEASDDLDETIPIETSKKKKRVVTENGDYAEVDTAPDKIEYWIVRKPKSIPLDKLPKFRVPKRFPAPDIAVLRPGSNEDYMNIKFAEPEKQMFYIDRRNSEKKRNGKNKVYPTGNIHGIMFMQPEDALPEIGPIPPEEDFLVQANCKPAMGELPSRIHSIRRKPNAGVYEPVERLKAFGAGFLKKAKKKNHLLN